MKRRVLTLALGIAALASAVLPAFGGTAAAAAPSGQVASTNSISIQLSPSSPNSFSLSGRLINLTPDVQSAIVTLQLNNGQIATQLAGAANGWTFNFTNIPNDGWKSIAVDPVTTGAPQYVAAGSNVYAYTYPNPYITYPTYRNYSWVTGYPAYTYTPGSYTYGYVPVHTLGYAYNGGTYTTLNYSNGACAGCVNWNYRTGGFVPYGYGYYYANGQYYYYPYTTTAAYTYGTLYDATNPYRGVTPTYTTYYYSPVVYSNGYYVNPGAIYLSGSYYYNAGILR